MNYKILDQSIMKPLADNKITQPNDKFFDQTKLKAFADDKDNVAQMIIFVFDGIENIVGKGENDGFQHFLLSP